MKIGDTIYLDHQATTPVDRRVLAEMTPYFSDLFANPHSVGHRMGWEAAAVVTDAAARVGRLIGADGDEIVFTSGATEANNLALLGAGRCAGAAGRRRVLLSAIEHQCALAAGRVLRERDGFAVETIPVDAHGFVDLARLEGMLDSDVALVSVIAVNNEIGVIQDTAAIAELCHRHGALFHCDAAQMPMAMDTGELARHADMLSLSAHKIYGPKGIGAAFIARDVQPRIEPLIHGGGQQNGLRAGTVPVALCVGMAAAADLLRAPDINEKRDVMRRRRDRFVDRLRGLGRPVSVNGPPGDARHPGNANIRFPGFAAADILGAAQPFVAASAGAACASGIPEPSHVLRAIGLNSAEADASIRFSLGFATTDADIDEAAGLVGEALGRLGG